MITSNRYLVDGKAIMATHVNLDALIPRDDFDIANPSQVGAKPDRIVITDLEKNRFFYPVLRKPDFGRETSEWDAQKVADLIESFLDGELIPAIILWRSADSFTYVIDGCHRLSSLLAWINDDYGDGAISKQFYDGIIPDEQISVAVRIRTLVNKRIGSYNDHLLANTNPEKVKPETVMRAKNLGIRALQFQWVEGDSSKAEQSFKNINQKASPIDATEMRVIEARRKPIGIAARAIVRSGKGHKYWSNFDNDNQGKLEQLAREVNALLFRPILPPSPIKTIELPIGGQEYASQSLPLVMEFIDLVNKAGSLDINTSDSDGTRTIACIARCKKIAELIESNTSASLGLHPAVYFYSSNGRHKIASFLAVTALMLDFETKDYYSSFTKIRSQFESLLIEYEYLSQQIVRNRRSATNSYLVMKEFYQACIEQLIAGKSIKETVETIVASNKFGQLILAPVAEEPNKAGGTFSKATKSKAFIKEALQSAIKCKVCGGYLHPNAMTIDHTVPKSAAGTNALDNAQITHPYCNSAKAVLK